MKINEIINITVLKTNLHKVSCSYGLAKPEDIVASMFSPKEELSEFEESGSVCDNCGDLVGNDYYVEGDTVYCQNCHDELFFYCESCSEYYPYDDEIYIESYGYSVCQSCYDNYYGRCSSCDTIVSTDNLTAIDGEYYCDNCVYYCNNCNQAITEEEYNDNDHLCEECKNGENDESED